VRHFIRYQAANKGSIGPFPQDGRHFIIDRHPAARRSDIRHSCGRVLKACRYGTTDQWIRLGGLVWRARTKVVA
jgi:hypothetical protein